MTVASLHNDWRRRIAIRPSNLIPLAPFSSQEKGEHALGDTPRPPSKGAQAPSAFPLAVLLLTAVTVMALAVAGCRGAVQSAEDGRLVVAAAADLRFAFEEIEPVFERQTGQKVTFIFGSTGNLAAQIEQGAPIDVFFAANESFIERLRERGRIIADSQRLYALGRIVIAVNRQSGVQAGTLADLAKPAIKRIAIANPEHAPYGAAAKQALERAGLWAQVQPKLVLAENISQAAQYLQTGNVEAAIIARSVADRPEISYQMIDDSLYDPLRQAAAVIASSPRQAQARRFLDFVTEPAGQQIMRKYGFTLPGER